MPCQRLMDIWTSGDTLKMAGSLDDNVRYFQEASSAEVKRIVEALYHVHRLMPAINDLDTLLVRITEESRQVARAEASSVMLFDPGTNELYFRVALGEHGDQETLKREIRLKPGQGIAGATAQTRTSIAVKNAQEDPRFFRDADAATQFETRNLLAVPMLDRDNLVGVLEVVNKRDGAPFSELDTHVMEMFASLAATSVTNARLIEEQIRNERLAAIGQAVTGLSHYTKNIVTGLSSSAELIDMGLDAENLDVLRRGWPIFKRSTKRISNFVEDMLSFSKPRKPIRERCEVADIIREAYETFTELFVQKRVEVEIHTEAAAPIWVDPQGLYRCLLNVLTNAADAVPEEGGGICITARSLDDHGLEIAVSDNGAGVPEADRARIFDPFFSTKGSRGTGLGLAVTQKIVNEHGGTILVETGPQGGAVFRIMLPPYAPPAEEYKGL